MVVIAHRLSTIKKADLIVVLDHGVIIQSGTWDELKKEKGRFQEILLAYER